MKKLKTNRQNYCSGQAVITVVVFFLFLLLIIVSGFVLVALREAKIAHGAIDSKKSYFLAEAGAEDLVYRIVKNKNYSDIEYLEIDGHSATTTIQTSFGNDKYIIGEGDVDLAVRKTKMTLSAGSGSSFYYGVQVGDGGLTMLNTSTVTGNVYSNGPISGANSNLIKGAVVSAGPSGAMNGVHATSSAYAHTISNSYIEGDAYYQNISGSTVLGDSFPASPDQPLSVLPIPDEEIADWESAAEDGGAINSPCPYVIDSDANLGPVKINCDLIIQGDPTITLGGMIWVAGNITVENTAIVRIDPALGSKSVSVIADNPSNRLTSSKVYLQNSAQFQGSGSDGSFVLVVSQNNSAQSGGSVLAVDVANTVSGKLLVYASHGEIQLQNSVNLKEVSGYRIRLKNSANIIYESGLASLIFETGPGGGYTLTGWEEI